MDKGRMQGKWRIAYCVLRIACVDNPEYRSQETEEKAQCERKLFSAVSAVSFDFAQSPS